ncbi:hypothetical protein AB1Y20_013347 [Prymnesium parvum]|uniref:Leishmanolysin-like peptidase n=1 Tax=Prymnesium parvum TaxID=97485 RepID=A0AB34IL17_PRYPA
MSLWLRSLPLLSLASPDRTHHCMHDSLRAAAPPLVAPQPPRPLHGRLAQAASAAPLRVVFNTETLEGDAYSCYAAGQTVRVGSPPEGGPSCSAAVQDDCFLRCTAEHLLHATREEQLRTRLLPAVAAWFGGALRILKPLGAPLRLREGACGFGGAIEIPPHLLEDGSPETDVLIFVTARPILGSALAFAGHCQEDEGSSAPYVPRRPLMGHINIDPASLGEPSAWHVDATHAQTVDSLLKVLIHETMHVLGFTYSKLVQFPCPHSPAYDRHRADGSVAPCPDGEPVAEVSYEAGGVPLVEKRVVTPRVVQAARAHWDCVCAAGEACVDGVALEGHGGEGTAASHWEARLMHGEVMVGAVRAAEVTPVSQITLALFEDSGWYAAVGGAPPPRCVYAAALCGDAEPLLWGRGRGCAFAAARCDGAAWRAAGYFCGAAGGEACTLGRRGVGYCTLTSHAAPLPPQFRYFSDPRLGGGALEDYCPFTQAYDGWDCRFAPARGGEAGGARGEARCGACRCFASSLANGTARAAEYLGCYEQRCVSRTQLQLRVGGEWHDCLSAGGTVAPAGWSGGVRCANASELCAEAEDLGWPSILRVAPAAGPAAGGTALTVAGAALLEWEGGALRLPRVFVCGVEAADVAAAGGGEGEAHALTLTAPRAPPLNWSCADALAPRERACAVRLLKAGGRYAQAAAAFTYLDPSPQPPPVDLACGWSLALAARLAARGWPYAAALLAAAAIARLAAEVRLRSRAVRRRRMAALRRAETSRTRPAEYAAHESL